MPQLNYFNTDYDVWYLLSIFKHIITDSADYFSCSGVHSSLCLQVPIYDAKLLSLISIRSILDHRGVVFSHWALFLAQYNSVYKCLSQALIYNYELGTIKNANIKYI